MLREQGYYTAFKGKWHLSAVPNREDALERYGFSDDQQWGEMFGAPLEGAQLDGTAVPRHEPALIERMLGKLHRLVQEEIGDDRAPFDLDMFGTREVKYRKQEAV